ncbi:MAG: thiamine-phosphate kinase [Acidobacteria bacterium]|nr:thiamine-phosphate kinase [Acidobacteriota bacterium]
MKKIAAIGEIDLIRRIEARFRRIGPLPRAGIGEDAAVIRLPGAGADLAISADLFLEGIHFRRRDFPAEMIGWKALAANLSDMAAMGARPLSYLLVLGLPGRLPESYFNGILSGLGRLSTRYRLRLLGGDTCKFSRLVVGITILGSLQQKRFLPRTGARPGDQLFVTGPLGGSAMGLQLLRRGWKWQSGRPLPPAGKDDSNRKIGLRAARQAMRAHLMPDPPVGTGILLARHRLASAAIDISDGLEIDLERLCRASGVGAALEEDAVPVAPCLREFRDPRRSRKVALSGGEDYELLIAVPPAAVPRLGKAAGKGRRFTCIGEVRPRRFGLRIRDARGVTRPLAPRGFRHFSS